MSISKPVQAITCQAFALNELVTAVRNIYNDRNDANRAYVMINIKPEFFDLPI